MYLVRYVVKINHRGGLSGKVYLEVSKPYESEYYIVIKPGD